MKPERTPEADRTERGLDELMLLAHSRHLSEEPEAQRGQPSAQPAQAAPAGPAKDDEVCRLILTRLPGVQIFYRGGLLSGERTWERE